MAQRKSPIPQKRIMSKPFVLRPRCASQLQGIFSKASLFYRIRPRRGKNRVSEKHPRSIRRASPRHPHGQSPFRKTSAEHPQSLRTASAEHPQGLIFFFSEKHPESICRAFARLSKNIRKFTLFSFFAHSDFRICFWRDSRICPFVVRPNKDSSQINGCHEQQ